MKPIKFLRLADSIVEYFNPNNLKIENKNIIKINCKKYLILFIELFQNKIH